MIHTFSDKISTAITVRAKLLLMTRPAVELTRLGPELLVHQAGLAGGAEEAGAVPVLTFVTQVLVRKFLREYKTRFFVMGDSSRVTYGKDDIQ